MPDVVWERRTPPGEGGVAKLRLRGAGAVGLASALLGRPLSPGRLVHGRLVDGDVLDEVLMRVEADRVDVCTHGGERALARVVAALEARGARAVAPVETPVLRARTGRALDVALRALRGGLREPVGAEAEAAARWGRALFAGRRLRLAGPPNAGCSTLLNALAGREVALVDAAPGTTRDRIEVTVDVDGVPVTCVDGPASPVSADAVVWLGGKASWDEWPGIASVPRRLWVGDGAPAGWDALPSADAAGVRAWVVADLGTPPASDVAVPLDGGQAGGQA